MMIASAGRKRGLVHRITECIGVRTFYTEPFENSTTAAAAVARRLRQTHITTMHLLLGLLEEGKTALQLLKGLGVDVEQLKQQADAFVQQESNSISPENLLFSKEADHILHPGAFLEARSPGARIAVIGSEHLLLALLKEENETASLLGDYGANYINARAMLQNLRMKEQV